VKFYHLFLLVLFIQCIFILPFQKNIEVLAQPASEEYAHDVLLGQGLGPMIFYGGVGAVTAPEGVTTSYFGFYLGNAAMNLCLAVCIVLLYKLKR